MLLKTYINIVLALPIGGYGEWNEWLPCGANVRLKYRICYGQTLSVCRGHGLQNGVQAVRETCTAEPLQAFMEGMLINLHCSFFYNPKRKLSIKI